MAKKRPSPVALVQSYFAEGPGAESAGLLAAVTNAAEDKPIVTSSAYLSADNKLSDGVMSDRVTVTQSNVSTVLPFDTHTGKPSDSMMVAQSHSQTVSQSDSSTASQSDGKTVYPSHSDTAIQSNGLIEHLEQQQAVPQETPQTVYHDTPKDQTSHPETVSYQTNYQAIPLDVLTLPYNQACVLEYLINAGGVTNARAISEATHIGIPSVRDALSRLIRRGFMPEPVTIRNAAFQGFSYVLNQTMVRHFNAAGGLEQKAYKQVSDRLISDRHTVLGSNRGTVTHFDSQTPISSSRTTELTTTPENQTLQPFHGQTVTPSHGQNMPPSDIRDVRPSDSQQSFILTGPTGIYWESEGLQERQAQVWCNQFEIDPVQLKQQLEWARHDLVINNKSAEVKKDSISWFFGVLRQTGGCYPKPSNYKSPAEIRAEQMEQAAKEASEARERQAAAERELAFQKIMNDPNSEEYRSLYAVVDDFTKELGGKALEAALKEAFISKR